MVTTKEIDLVIENYRLIKKQLDEILEMVEQEDLSDAIASLGALIGTMYHAVRILEASKREHEQACQTNPN